jgi:hypothetical protein
MEMPLANPHDKPDLIRKMNEIRGVLVALDNTMDRDSVMQPLVADADDVLAYLGDDRVHYGCPLDDPCGFGEDNSDEIQAGDTVELIHDVWSLLKGQRFRAKIYSCSNGRWYCESIDGLSIAGWIDGDDLRVVEIDAVPSPLQDLTTAT